MHSEVPSNCETGDPKIGTLQNKHTWVFGQVESRLGYNPRLKGVSPPRQARKCIIITRQPTPNPPPYTWLCFEEKCKA